ncbi:MAG: transcription termination/antitermination protein NusA [Clostridiales bacterium]|nr:transcription termination/antitermination protein NusA [Clostridiales bacterium]
MDTIELFESLAMLAREKGIEPQVLSEKIQTALTFAIKKDFPGSENIKFDVDMENGVFNIAILKNVVEEVEDEGNEITLDEAINYSKRYKIGDVCEIPIDPKRFRRIAAQNAKQVIKQGLKEIEKEQLEKQWGELGGEAVPAQVIKVETRTGNATIVIDGNEIQLYKSDQIPGEVLTEGTMIKVLVSTGAEGGKRQYFKVTRTHRDLIKRLFELEVPEIYDGIVEIKAISREAGIRSKIAVISHDENIDAVGSCIGPARSRISKVCEELAGEKIDVVLYSDVPEEFIAQALKPADVVSVEIPDQEVKACTVLVPDGQLSLAIGNKGQNAKLAAKLTGYKIDIRPESGYFTAE